MCVVPDLPSSAAAGPRRRLLPILSFWRRSLAGVEPRHLQKSRVQLIRSCHDWQQQRYAKATTEGRNGRQQHVCDRRTCTGSGQKALKAVKCSAKLASKWKCMAHQRPEQGLDGGHVLDAAASGRRGRLLRGGHERLRLLRVAARVHRLQLRLQLLLQLLLRRTLLRRLHLHLHLLWANDAAGLHTMAETEN